MSGPVVTTVIPTYQMRRWVCDAVDSALAQEPAGEVVVVDDGSTDGTAALLRERYGERIRYRRQENRGLPAARNAGLALARGRYIQFLDADDLIAPDKLARQVAALDAATGHDIAYSDFASFHDDPAATLPGAAPDVPPSGDILTPLLAGNFIVCHAALARTRVLRDAGGFDETLRACEDYDLWLRLAAAGHRFLHTPGALALYRRRGGSMSSDRPHQIRATIEVLERLDLPAALDGARTESLDRLRDALTLALAREAGSALGHMRLVGAARHVLRALSHDPGGWPRRLRKALGRLWHPGRRSSVVGRRSSGEGRSGPRSSASTPGGATGRLARLDVTVSRVRAGLMARRDPIGAKRLGELAYWKERAHRDGGLAGTHYLWFFTDHYGLDVADYRDRAVLDVGCGPRGSLEWAAATRVRVGLDPLAADYRRLGTGAHAMDYVAATAGAMPFPSAAFHIVSAFNALDHVDDVDAAIVEVIRVLRPGGSLLLLVEVNHAPTTVEPISLDWDVVSRFEPVLEPVEVRRYEMTDAGLYQSVYDDARWDGARTDDRAGILSARLVKRGG